MLGALNLLQPWAVGAATAVLDVAHTWFYYSTPGSNPQTWGDLSATTWASLEG